MTEIIEKLCKSLLPSIDIIEDNEIDFRKIEDISDYLLEKADICIDEHTGVRQKNKQINVTKQMLLKEQIPQSIVEIKPQLSFQDKIDNFKPYVPKLIEKPFAKIPLELSICILLYYSA